jgi:hypothetical protein
MPFPLSHHPTLADLSLPRSCLLFLLHSLTGTSSSGFQLKINDALKGIRKAHKDDTALEKPGWFFQGSITRE